MHTTVTVVYIGLVEASSEATRWVGGTLSIKSPRVFHDKIVNKLYL